MHDYIKKRTSIDKDMYRTHTCGELRLSDANKDVTLAGWVQRTRKMGGMTFVDLRDRYGITQLVFNEGDDAALCEQANKLGREYVIQARGRVCERSSKNAHIPTGDIEIAVTALTVLNTSLTPPFTIEDNTDGGDDIRMKFRYLDLRRAAVRKNLELRHRMTMEVRRYLDSQGFLEIETPMLVGSTPEGARDFVVPSRMNPGQFYALPQSPQTLKQLLMVSGMDRYFQIVKCFRDEDLRADRQPEFTQIDCEMSFVEQEDIIQMFEGMAKHLFKELRGVELTEPFQRMPWSEAMKLYGSDKPDLRFGMQFVELMDVLKGYGFSVFDNAAYIGGICAEGAAHYTRKQIDQLTDFVKKPQIGAKGLVYARVEADGNVKSSVDKFYPQEVLQQMKEADGNGDGTNDHAVVLLYVSFCIHTLLIPFRIVSCRTGMKLDSRIRKCLRIDLLRCSIVCCEFLEIIEYSLAYLIYSLFIDIVVAEENVGDSDSPCIGIEVINFARNHDRVVVRIHFAELFVVGNGRERIVHDFVVSGCSQLFGDDVLQVVGIVGSLAIGKA